MTTLDLQDYSLNNYLSNRNNNFGAGGFNGLIEFKRTLPSETAIDNLKHGYFSLTATVTVAMTCTSNPGAAAETGGDAAAIAAAVLAANTAADGIDVNHYITQNPVGVLFSSTEFWVNETQVQQISNWGVHTTHNKLLFETESQQIDNGTPIYASRGGTRTVLNYVQDRNRTGYYTIRDRFVQGRRVMGNVIRTATGTGSRVDGATLVTSNMPIDEAFSGTIASFVLSTTFPIPFLNDLEDSEDSTLYGNSTYSFKFQVSPTLQQDLIVGLGATLTSMGINVTSFELVLPEYKLQSPPLNLKLRRPFYDTRSFRNTFNAQSFQYMIPAATKRVTISFMRHSAAQNTTDAEYVMPTRVLTIAGGTYVQTLGVPGGAAAASLLTRIYVNFNGHNYPKQPYYVKDDDATGATSHRRAYEDYLRLSQSYIAGQKNILATFDQWLEHPVYCMQVTGAPNSSGEAQLSVYTEGLAAGDSNYDICVTADYIKELEIDYNQYGVPEATRVAILA